MWWGKPPVQRVSGPAGWRAGRLAGWRAGGLTSWRAGELASWRADGRGLRSGGSHIRGS